MKKQNDLYRMSEEMTWSTNRDQSVPARRDIEEPHCKKLGGELGRALPYRNSDDVHSVARLPQRGPNIVDDLRAATTNERDVRRRDNNSH